MTKLTRRNVLLSTAAVGAAGLAGCVGDSEDDESANAGASDGTDNGSENGNESTAGNETETDDGTDGADSGEESGSTGGGSDHSNITLETVGAACAEGDNDSVTINWTESGISIEGAMQTPNPCHKAVLGGVTVENGQLTVDVSAESTLSEDEVCTPCVGEVLYTVDVPLSNSDSLARVTVSHPDDEQITVDADDIEPAE